MQENGEAKPADASVGTQWPMSFRMQPQHGRPWWSHTFYRNADNQGVEILYSSTREESERLARQFLHEPVVGFDMEWPWYAHKKSRLQDKVALIQIACEDKIALFHIGRHAGRTTNEVIAPSLRKIIESPDIIKTGVAVHNCDMGRLKKFFGLRPQAPFELSHLHRLVVYGQRNPSLVTTKMVKLSQLVEHHLRLPLFKGDVRTSNWSKPLDNAQKEYAAADAYAGYALYRCMNARRLRMNPAPPLPLMADSYPPGTPKDASLRLGLPEEYILASEFFHSVADEAQSADNPKESGITPVGPITKTKKESSEADVERRRTAKTLDPVSQILYDQLAERRKVLAVEASLPPYRIANNVVLEALAKDRPTDEGALLQTKGIGPKQQANHGSHWLEIIQAFIISLETEAESTVKETEMPSLDGAQSPQTPEGQIRERRNPLYIPEMLSSSPSSSAFDPPKHPIAQLHTGLSFTLGSTKLQDADDAGDNSDENSTAFVTPLSRPPSQCKRKRSMSPMQSARISPEPERVYILTREDKVFRNKLAALRSMVTAQIRPKPAEILVADSVLDSIVSKPPRTQDELTKIVGATVFAEACIGANKNLLANIIKWAPVRY